MRAAARINAPKHSVSTCCMCGAPRAPSSRCAPAADVFPRHAPHSPDLCALDAAEPRERGRGQLRGVPEHREYALIERRAAASTGSACATNSRERSTHFATQPSHIRRGPTRNRGTSQSRSHRTPPIWGPTWQPLAELCGTLSRSLHHTDGTTWPFST